MGAHENAGVEVRCSGGNGGKEHACAVASVTGTHCDGPACRFDGLMAPIAEGSNILTVTIKPLTVGRAVSARFRLKVQNVQDSFSSCEDNKVCLGVRGLGEMWSSPYTKDLRMSIFLQWTCLTDVAMTGYEDHGPVCKRWRECLTAANRFQDIRNILEARGAS